MSTPHYADMTVLEAAEFHKSTYKGCFEDGYIKQELVPQARHHHRMAKWLFELHYLRAAKENVRIALASAERFAEMELKETP